MPVRTLVVWCPDWPIVAAGLADEVPAAVLVANRVVACSPGARHEGVCLGLRRREAQARCPELVVLEADPAGEARAFEPVVAAVAAFTPRVEIVRPGTCALATRGPSRYFKGDARLASLVEQAASQAAGRRCRVGVADGPFAADLAARRSAIVPSGQSASFLAPLPLEPLDRPELIDLLRRLGIRTLGEFAALPSPDVLARFGPDGAMAHRLARGLDERPLAAEEPPPDLSVATEIDPPADRVDLAAFVARGLAEQFHQGLHDRGLACTRVVIEAETEHGEGLVRLWRHDGVLTPTGLADRVRWQLEGWLTGTALAGETITSGITRLSLTPDEVVPDRGRQLGFWGGSAAVDDRASRAMARVQGLLGPERVMTAVLGGGRDPADQIRLVPWGDARQPHRPGDPLAPPDLPPRPGRRQEIPPWPGRLPAPAPARVFDPPGYPVDVTDEAGRVVTVSARGEPSAPPARLTPTGSGSGSASGSSSASGAGTASGTGTGTASGTGIGTGFGDPFTADEVIGWAGPWPVEERWWDPPAQRRRARFQVATAGGAAYLLAVEGGRWWVQAIYD